MYFVVGALVLLAAAPFLVETSAPQHPKADVDLTEVVNGCMKKGNITCGDLAIYLVKLPFRVGNNRNALCFLACLEIDSKSMFPGEPFYLPNYHRWYKQYQWPLIDAGVTKCSSGKNMYIEDVCDREYDYISCLKNNSDYGVCGTSGYVTNCSGAGSFSLPNCLLITPASWCFDRNKYVTGAA